MEADLEALAAVWEGTMFSGPWGWSLATKRRYERMGVPVELLPSDDWIEEVRKLSSREYACEYIKELLEEFQDERLLGDGMFFCKDVSTLNSQLSTLCPQLLTLNSQLSTLNCHLIFKSPWSSSGRGVFVDRMADGKCQMSTLKRLQGFLSSQGGFVVDRFYENKVLDFAMEFFVHEDHTQGRMERMGIIMWRVRRNCYGALMWMTPCCIGSLPITRSTLLRLPITVPSALTCSRRRMAVSILVLKSTSA